jgi:hypothetical protein
MLSIDSPSTMTTTMMNGQPVRRIAFSSLSEGWCDTLAVLAVNDEMVVKA